jgi:hypothetical protein
LRRFRLTMPRTSAFRSAVHCLAIGIVAGFVTILLPTTSRADDDGARPTPRAWVKIGDASVVLIASGDKIYAFVDRIDDNAPVEDAELQIDTAEGPAITMNRAPIVTKATAGLFVGTLNRAGHMQDAFMISLTSSAGTGEAPVEITYTDAEDKPVVAAPPGNEAKIAVAVVSGAIGAVGMVMVMLWLGGGGRRGRTSPARTARAA